MDTRSRRFKPVSFFCRSFQHPHFAVLTGGKFKFGHIRFGVVSCQILLRLLLSVCTLITGSSGREGPNEPESYCSFLSGRKPQFLGVGLQNSFSVSVVL